MSDPKFEEAKVAYDFDEKAWVVYIPQELERVSIKEAEPIKKLIAAAPELYEAGMQVSNALKNEEWVDWKSLARALKKATE